MGSASERIRSAEAIGHWDGIADVIVVGLGAAGACAALEARAAGADVLALERAAQPGGTSAISAGQIYMGAGTQLQKECGFDDSAEAMAAYMRMACGPGADEEKIALYCERSPEHYQWLVARGVPFKATYLPPEVAMNPPGDDGLTYTGSELAHPFAAAAKPAPRGHNVQNEGDSGVVLMRALVAAVEQAGGRSELECRAEALAVDAQGRVVGVGVEQAGAKRWFAARRGVVLSTGGFGANRAMLQRHAPRLTVCHPIGVEGGEDGSGIVLGQAAGGETLRMDSACVLLPYTKPRQLVKGILVNAQGQRFVNEDIYQSLHGEVAFYEQRGQVYLIVDAATFAKPSMPYPLLAQCASLGELTAALEFPEGSLECTLAVYNAGAAQGRDPLFHKAAGWLTPLSQAPWSAFDLRVSTMPYPFFTLGGLRTDTDSAVLGPDGERIPGLFAAGRTTSGLPAQGYSSGTSLADATFFGRRAGASAAAQTAARLTA